MGSHIKSEVERLQNALGDFKISNQPITPSSPPVLQFHARYYKKDGNLDIDALIKKREGGQHLFDPHWMALKEYKKFGWDKLDVLKNALDRWIILDKFRDILANKQLSPGETLQQMQKHFDENAKKLDSDSQSLMKETIKTISRASPAPFRKLSMFDESDSSPSSGRSATSNRSATPPSSEAPPKRPLTPPGGSRSGS